MNVFIDEFLPLLEHENREISSPALIIVDEYIEKMNENENGAKEDEDVEKFFDDNRNRSN